VARAASAPSDAVAWKFLVLLGVLNLGRSAIHVFAHDRGAVDPLVAVRSDALAVPLL
jgi:hypothetical protein